MRAKEISKLLENIAPDVICLQEGTNKPKAFPSGRKSHFFAAVVSKFIGAFLSEPWVRAQYCVSCIAEEMKNYGCWILSKIPIFCLSVISLPTEMERECLVTECMINNEPVGPAFNLRIPSAVKE